MATDPGVFLSKPLALDLQELNRERRRNPPPPPRPRPHRDLGGRPPIRAILLQDLPDGGQADAAVTQLEETNEIQQVEIIGDTVSGGTFTLTFKGKTTSKLNFNCSAADMQAALAGPQHDRKGKRHSDAGERDVHQ